MNRHAAETVSTVIPALRYRDATAAVRFLCRAFGFEVDQSFSDDQDCISHAELSFGNGMVMVGSSRDDEFGKLQQPLGDADAVVSQSIYLVVGDVDGHHEHAAAAGARIVWAPRDEEYGARDYACRDPEGNLWVFGDYDPWRS